MIVRKHFPSNGGNEEEKLHRNHYNMALLASAGLHATGQYIFHLLPQPLALCHTVWTVLWPSFNSNLQWVRGIACLSTIPTVCVGVLA